MLKQGVSWSPSIFTVEEHYLVLVFEVYLLEKVVDPARDESPVSAGDEVRVDCLRAVRLHPVVTSYTVEDANAVSSSRRRRIRHYPSLLDRLIRSHKGNPLCWVNLGCLARRDVEEARVECSRIIEPAPERRG